MTREILIATKALLEKEGWWSIANPPLRGYCLALAINKVIEDIIFQNHHTTTLLLKDISGSTSLVSWNDTEGRTEKEVFDLLDKAIELCK